MNFLTGKPFHHSKALSSDHFSFVSAFSFRPRWCMTWAPLPRQGRPPLDYLQYLRVVVPKLGLPCCALVAHLVCRPDPMLAVM